MSNRMRARFMLHLGREQVIHHYPVYRRVFPYRFPILLKAG